MAKVIPDTIIDSMLDLCDGTAVHVCSAEPTTYAEAATTYNLASETVTGGNFAKANGDTSGRKNTCTPGTGTSITSSGTATHVAITDAGTTLVLVTTCTSQALTSGGTVDIGAFAHEIGDPS